MDGGCDRVDLDEECWLDVHRGWVRDHEALMHELSANTPWEQEHIVLFGRQVLQPRLTAWFGLGMDASTRYRTTKPSIPWSARLGAMRRDLAEHVGVDFNSALANLYRGGRDSVGWHADDEPALGHDPVIASVSLGGDRRFRLRRRDKSRSHELLLGHGDLVVMHGAMQRLWLHCVPKTAQPGSARINLTFRRYELDV